MAISFGRRAFLGAGGLAALAGFLPLRRLLAGGGSPSLGFGPLQPDPNGILDLPAGFAYRVLDRGGDAMDDGYRVPGRPDGMAAFAAAET